jgi:adenosylmethionine-8-amino-7-oxononanoate aminotransferase
MNAEAARRYMELDKAHVWHPFTAMQQWLDTADISDCVIADADGFELVDIQGRRYIDGFGSLWCNLHGHRVARIDAAIRAQLDRVAHSTLLGFSSLPSIDLAAKLVSSMPACMRSTTLACWKFPRRAGRSYRR